jgi:hypothetical protein
MNKFFTVKVLTLSLFVVSIIIGVSSCDRDGWDKTLGPEGMRFSLYFYVEGIGGKDLCYELLDMAKWSPTNAPKEQAYYAEFCSDDYKMSVKYLSDEKKVKGYQRAYEVQLYMALAKNGKWYLESDCIATGIFEYETLTYELRFPALFSDDEVHRLIAKWGAATCKVENTYYPICESIEIDGEKYDVKQIEHPVYKGGIANVVTIHLDR